MTMDFKLPTRPGWRRIGDPVSQEKYIPLAPPYPLSKDVTEALLKLDHALQAENRDLLCVGIKDMPEGQLCGHVRLFDPSKVAVNESVAVLQRRCDEALARAGRECDHWKTRALGSMTRIRELENALVKSNALLLAANEKLANPIMMAPAGIPVQLPAAADGRYLQVHVTASDHIDGPPVCACPTRNGMRCVTCGGWCPRDCGDAEKALLDPINQRMMQHMSEAAECGPGIEKLPPRDDSHYVLEVDLLADDA